ncbi:hypothetical protein [Vibrio sp. SCSIO 43137]|uniref:hypothetical protein n=1 Tax=Vibrio sp. SCSIO 43137 TaxID=3021011 RepID=UPI0023074BC0|nr:hypothetical protein [Vibrio sp. SCSIO 43137]WCE28411.1 hypothetical protein PK654_08460 [Vibrio sp. SCSIO 43137]
MDTYTWKVLLQAIFYAGFGLYFLVSPLKDYYDMKVQVASEGLPDKVELTDTDKGKMLVGVVVLLLCVRHLVVSL